jgi:DNA-binding Lrp family transcriptional regulator
MTAYVLIQKQPDSEAVAARLRSMPEIVSADDLTGAFDAIALARAASSRDLFETVLPRIRELPGVTQALPAPLVHAFTKDRARVPAGEAA